MKIPLIPFFAILLLIGCKNSSTKNNTSVHEVVVREAINTPSYTYVLATENDSDRWIAIPLKEVTKGGKYYYTEGTLMYHFTSKELHRTFERILFLETLSNKKDNLKSNAVTMHNRNMTVPHRNINTIHLRKMNIIITPVKGCITVAQLYQNPEIYTGKLVKIKGIVTKFSPDIMKKNWIHLQDGTENDGKFDLAITTQTTIAVGDTIVMEGKIATHKDFGYGYYYDVLLEDASIIH